MAAPGQKIRVGVIFSDGDNSSFESINLAKYIAAHLVGTGWSTVSLIGFKPGDVSNNFCNERIVSLVVYVLCLQSRDFQIH